MRWIAAAAMLALVTSANAADITVTLNDKEQAALAAICDAATWASRMQFDTACAYFKKKIETAAAPQDPAPAAPAPK